MAKHFHGRVSASATSDSEDVALQDTINASSASLLPVQVAEANRDNNPREGLVAAGLPLLLSRDVDHSSGANTVGDPDGAAGGGDAQVEQDGSSLTSTVDEEQQPLTGQLQPQVDHSKAQKLKCAAKAIIILVLGLAIGLLGFGLYYVIVLHSNAAKSQSILGHRNDTILLLGGVSSFRTSKVTVSQCLNRGDDYHNVSIFLRNSKDTVLEPDSSFVEFPLHYQNTPSHKSGIQDYLYLLENSNFTYWMCLASTTSYDQGVTYFLFRGESNYRKYVNDPTCGEQCSLLSVPFVAEKNNRTNCKKIQYTVSQADYYFMVVRSPANISYSYNFTLRKIAYDTGNARRVCSISDSGSCEFALPGISNKYDILAYIQPQTLVEESITTHLCASGTISSSINTGAIAALVLGLTACGIIALCVLIKRFLIKRLRTASNT